MLYLTILVFPKGVKRQQQGLMFKVRQKIPLKRLEILGSAWVLIEWRSSWSLPTKDSPIKLHAVCALLCVCYCCFVSPQWGVDHVIDESSSSSCNHRLHVSYIALCDCYFICNSRVGMITGISCLLFVPLLTNAICTVHATTKFKCKFWFISTFCKARICVQEVKWDIT